MWRPEDDALIERLEDELVLERVWRHQAPADVPPPHPRAAGMIALARRAPGGKEAIADALADHTRPERFKALFERLTPTRFADQPPELLHHVALYYGRLADALAATRPDQSLEARVRSLGAWIALGEEKSYLRSLAAAIAGGAVAKEDIERAAENAAVEPIDELGRIAREGAHAQTTASALAVAALARIADACKVAGCSSASTQALTRRAERARTNAAEEALAPIQEALTEAAARGDSQRVAPELFQRVADAWRWSGEDEAIEIFAIEQVTPIAWEIQRESRWSDLNKLIEPVVRLSERLADRIEADPTRIAYAAPCAQIFVFRVEITYFFANLDQRLKLGERALKLCPSHRNGRLVLASALCDYAVSLVPRGGYGMSPSQAYDTAEAYVTRAEKLFPDLKKLEDTKKKIEEARPQMKGSGR